MPRKKNTLKESEKRLLLYPPNEGTWICQCEFYNKTNDEKCLWCNRAKDKKVRLLWPIYIAVCAKVGIEPGLRWRQRPDGTAQIRNKGGSWKAISTTEVKKEESP